MVFGSPFFAAGIFLMFVGTLIMGLETAGRMAEEIKGFTERKKHE